jgi:hypothetical protein
MWRNQYLRCYFLEEVAPPGEFTLNETIARSQFDSDPGSDGLPNFQPKERAMEYFAGTKSGLGLRLIHKLSPYLAIHGFSYRNCLPDRLNQ